MFFEDLGPKRRQVGLRALPAVPHTGWRPPTDYPNLSGAFRISIDTETYDPQLNEAGPGWARNHHTIDRRFGHVVGISLAAVDLLGNSGKWYFPIRHEVDGHENMDPGNTLRYLAHTLGNPNQSKVGAHLLYDLGWLAEEGVIVRGELHDVQYAEALIDNNALVGLDTLAAKYLGEHKTTDLLQAWVMEAYKPPKSYWRREIYRSPPSLVGPYAEDDALLPLRILPLQGPILDAEYLTYPYRLECDLIPLLIRMRQAGVYTNVDKAARLAHDLKVEISALYDKVEQEFGHPLENRDGERSSHSIPVGRLFDYLNIKYLRTKAGNPSVEKEWLEAQGHPAAKLVHDIREREKIVGTFIESYILAKNVNGFLYPEFNPVRGDDGSGTMVYRFSSSNPNLQNIPSRTKLGKKVRECFEPDPGHSNWRKKDYSQIHYRLLAHNAVDKGDGSAERLRQAYINDPDLDYHFNVYKDTAPLMGWSTDYTKVPNEQGELDYNEEILNHRRRIKNINFSGLYGVGEKTLVYKYLTGMSEADGKNFLARYHEGNPYIKATMEAIGKEAELNGFVTTLLGRRIRFFLYEPRFVQGRERPPARRYEDAINLWGSAIQLAGLYRAVNYKFQGSEPDIMKSAMRDLDRSGVLDFVGVPRLTVHDELDWSQINQSPEMEEAFRYVQYVMQNALKLRVPVKVDSTRGANWGKTK